MTRRLIKNADVFNGKDPALLENAKIVIEDDLVTDILQGDISETEFDSVLDAGGLTALPGLTDAHVHVSITAPQTGQ